MDEPEAPLSFSSTRRLVARLDQLRKAGAQVVVATHSPLLTALPGATILELGAHGIRGASWSDLEIVGHWRRFLDRPAACLDPLLDQVPQSPAHRRSAPRNCSTPPIDVGC